MRRPADLAHRLSHVRWLAGGTGSGKSTLARALAEQHDVLVYDGDRAERGYVGRCTARDQPYLWALLNAPAARRWTGRSAQEVYESMPSLHGETFGFVVDDLLALPVDRPILVDDFRTLPREVAPLLTWPEQAAFLLPTPVFRDRALRTRFADPARARANWGDGDHDEALTLRLARDELWDAEIRRQAVASGLPVVTVDGARDVRDLADDLAARFRLG
ncbi:AAA domain-containing protein [Micromonospora humi]|uniref:AAA domain-containing protein n=1 Tax=Micromonospora humi TaxID=745366 RepID=A0A1C5HEU9_9ACTN|nr:AAA domain-containing protein [Micromonospora humi]